MKTGDRVFEVIPAHDKLQYYTIVQKVRGGIMLHNEEDGSVFKTTRNSFEYFYPATEENIANGRLLLLYMVEVIKIKLKMETLNDKI